MVVEDPSRTSDERERNETLDCRLQAHAALCLLNPVWAMVERRLAPRVPRSTSQVWSTVPAATRNPFGLAGGSAVSGTMRVKARDPWVNRWRG